MFDAKLRPLAGESIRAVWKIGHNTRVADFARNVHGRCFVSRLDDVALTPIGNAGMHDWLEIREQHGPLVWRTVYRILRDHAEALDCLQDVFAEVIARPPPQTILSWPAFLRWLAVRRALDRLRRRRAEARRVVPIDETADFCSSAREPQIEAEWNELTERVRNEVRRLPRQQAEAFWLQCVEQMSQSEIGELLGVTPGAVGVLVHRARQRLRQTLSDLNPVEQEGR
jgi:RNA polymerase sigma-70 factor, ECF subfamily